MLMVPAQPYTVVDVDGNVVTFDANDNRLGVVSSPALPTWVPITLGIAILSFVMLKKHGRG